MTARGAWVIAGLFTLDRMLKLTAVQRFLRRSPPPAPVTWPSVTLLQPITRGASDLEGALACRAALHYAGRLQHLLICDAADALGQAQCRTWMAAHPHIDTRLLVMPQGQAEVATKVQKLLEALPHAGGEVLMFVDDDILLRPDAAEGLVRHLEGERAGAVFGLAAYTNWSNTPSSLLSAFVNGNALLSYIPLTYLAEPFTITGHFYALRRSVFDAIGGLDDMSGRFDDDHELARRVAQGGLANVQTQVIYDVDNYLATFDDYANQMQRWFVIPRQTMAPCLSPRQQLVSLLGSVGSLLPSLLAALTLLGLLKAPFRPRIPSTPRPSLAPLCFVLALHATVYGFCTRTYLHRVTPWRRTPLVLLSALVAPLQALGGLLGPTTFRWRGQRIRLHRGGHYDVL